MKKWIIPFIAAIAVTTLSSTSALADQNMLIRVKSGVNYPQSNTYISHYTPIAVDWAFSGTAPFAFGVEGMRTSGSHGASVSDGTNTVGYNLSRTLYLAMATGEYQFTLGYARIGAGLKAGAMFFDESSDLSSGPTDTTLLPPTQSRTLFAAGPMINIDLPVLDTYFVNVGGDYIFSRNDYFFGSLYVGAGIDF